MHDTRALLGLNSGWVTRDTLTLVMVHMPGQIHVHLELLQYWYQRPRLVLEELTDCIAPNSCWASSGRRALLEMVFDAFCAGVILSRSPDVVLCACVQVFGHLSHGQCNTSVRVHTYIDLYCVYESQSYGLRAAIYLVIYLVVLPCRTWHVATIVSHSG